MPCRTWWGSSTRSQSSQSNRSSAAGVKAEGVGTAVLDPRVAGGPALEGAVVHRDHPGAPLGRAVAPAARGGSQVGDRLSGDGFAAEIPYASSSLR